MSTEKQPEAIGDLPKPKLDDAAAEQVKGGADPVSGRPKPAEPINDLRKR